MNRITIYGLCDLFDFIKIKNVRYLCVVEFLQNVLIVQLYWHSWRMIPRIWRYRRALSPELYFSQMLIASLLWRVI